MESSAGLSAKKPHAVCIPYPAQGHINPMMKMAKLLHSKGFHVTFVNTVFNHRRLLRARGPHALDGLPSFRFETIPDGLPESDIDATQDVPALCASVMNNLLLTAFRDLLRRINQQSIDGGDFPPPVSCVVSDGLMTFTLDVAEELGVPEVLLWTVCASACMALIYYHQLVDKGLVPLKDESDLTNGYLDKKIDWIPSMKNMRLRDFPSFVRTTDPHDTMLNFILHETGRANRATAVAIITFDELERDVISSLSSILPPIYTVGPLQLLVNHEMEEDSEIGRLGSSLWKEDTGCLSWLDTKPPNSVIYLNFGSVAVMTKDQFVEFAWGLAATGKPFLWVIRPDLVVGDVAELPLEFLTETAERGMVASWCPQEKVLLHSAVGGFLTHCGWNSTSESISGGVPVICWPFFGDQQTNCKCSRDDWGIGMEISGQVKRQAVESVIRELMDGEKGKKMREKAEEWQRLAKDATAPPCGSSYMNFEKLVNEVLLCRR